MLYLKLGELRLEEKTSKQKEHESIVLITGQRESQTSVSDWTDLQLCFDFRVKFDTTITTLILHHQTHNIHLRSFDLTNRANECHSQ